MKKFMWIASLLTMLLMVRQSLADLAFTSSPSLTFAPDSGVQSIPIFAAATSGTQLAGSVEALLTISSPGGMVTFATNNPSGFDAAQGGQGVFSYAASPALSNMVAAGTNGFDASASVGSPAGFLSIEFQSNQSFTTSPTLLADLQFNINGLTPGTYNFAIDNTLAALGVSTVATIGSVGSFTISAVPEPTSILTAASLGMAGVFVRRRRLKKSK